MSKVITIAYISRNTKGLSPYPKDDYPKEYYLRNPMNYKLAGLSQLFNNEIVSENNSVK